MKKTLTLLSFLPLVGFAQVREKGSIELQPFAGFSTSKLYTSQKVNNKNIVSPYFGVNLEYYFSKKWSLKTGLEYLQMGSKSSGVQHSQVEERYSNLALPLHASVHLLDNRNLYINFGPTFTYGIKYEDSFGMDDINNIDQRFYLGIGVGVGYKYPITDKISLGIDYQSFTRIPKFIEFAGTTDYYYMYGNSALNIKAVFQLK